MLTLRDAAVALGSATLSLAISLGVLGMGAAARKGEVDAMEARLVERIEQMKARTDELSQQLDRCRLARGQAAGEAP